MNRGRAFILITALLFVVAGGLAACSGDGQEGGSEDQLTIEIFQGKVEFRDQFITLADIYEEQNPNININFSAVGGGSDYFTSLRSRFSSGDEPDVFSLSGPEEADDYENYLTDLTDTEAASQAIEGTLDGMTEDGKVYGLPFNQEGYGFIYNKRIFDEAGIDPNEITTYDDLEEAVQTLDSKKDELGIKEVFALPGAEDWVLTNHLANVYLAPEFNHDVMEMYESESIAFERGDEIKRVLDLQNNYSIQPTLNLDYSQQVEQYFALEDVAMIQQGDWIYPTLEQMDPEFAQENVGVIPIPMEGYEGTLPVGVPNYWAINNNADEEVIEAAKDFFDWMYTSEEGIKAVQENLDFIPAYEGFDPDAISASLSNEIYEYVLDGQTTGWVFTGYPQAWSSNFGAGLQAYIADYRSWEEVIDSAKTEWSQIKEYTTE